MTPYLIACLVVALPALFWRRCGPLAVRVAGVATAAIVAAGVLDPQREVAVESPAIVRLVPTAAGSPELATLRATIGAKTAVEDAPVDCDLIEAVAGAMLRDGGQRRVVPVVIWTGPFEVPVSTPAGPPPTVLSLAPAPPIEPEDCRLAAIAPLHAERPGLLELQVAAPTVRPTCRLQVRDAAGALVAEREGPLPEVGPLTLAWTPAAAGTHRFTVTIEAAGSRITGAGALDVAPARLVRVIGADAAAAVAALRVQGHRVEPSATVPVDLADTDVLVLLDRLPVDDQQRVAAFVDAGGGAFFVGGADGGAFPRQGEPLHAVLPLNWTPPPPPAEAAPDVGNDAPASPEPPPERQPEPPKSPPEGEAAQGKTAGASLPGPTEVEVERRSIAMVLVIDRSGSMDNLVLGGRGNRMDYAKRSAYETAASLEAGDQVAVVTFGVNGQIVLPLTPATDLLQIRERVEGLRAVDSQTLLEHALRITREQVLHDCHAAVKHVVVITDGEIFDLNRAHLEARKLREAGATVSLIKILSGDQLYKDLPDLARVHGGGEFYAASSAERVPSLVSSEVTMALGRVGRLPKRDGGSENSEPMPPAQPEPEPPSPEPESKPLPEPRPVEPPAPTVLAVRAVTRSPLLEPPPHPDFPTVGGILAAAARPEARVLLVAGDEGIALLAFANRGLGKAGAWSADFFGEWGSAWRADADFPGRLSAWVTSLAPPAGSDDRDRLAEAGLEPPAPVRAERRYLEAWSGGPFTAITDWQPPPAASHRESRSLARECAGAAVLALLVLALFEFVALRRGRF